VKKIVLLSSTLIGLMCSGRGLISAPEAGPVPFAPKPVVIEPTKHAFVRIEKIMPMDNPDQGCHEWRDDAKKVADYRSNEVARMQADYQKLQELEESYKKGAKYMDVEATTKKSRELEDLGAKLQRDQEDLKRTITGQLQNMQAKLAGKIEKIAHDFFVKKQGWDAVSIASIGTLAISERVDVTDEMKALLNKEYDAQKAKETTASKPAIASKPVAKKT
jgi:putative sterol carrier protein